MSPHCEVASGRCVFRSVVGAGTQGPLQEVPPAFLGFPRGTQFILGLQGSAWALGSAAVCLSHCMYGSA